MDANIANALDKIRRDAPYKAPEVRAAWLADYLEAYGVPLLDALRALPAEEREGMGIEEGARRAGMGG